MGKWAEVYCNCPNRAPRPNSDFFSRPHRNKRRLTTIQKKEVAEWEQTTEGQYECGYQNGAIIELWPGNIIQLGSLIDDIFSDIKMFEIFPRLGDWRCYSDELLLVTPDEAMLWQLEIEELQQAWQGVGRLPRSKVEKLFIEINRIKLGTADQVLEDAIKLCQASIRIGNPIRFLR